MIAEDRLQALVNVKIDKSHFASYETPLMTPEMAENPYRFFDDVRKRHGDVIEVHDNHIDGVLFPTLIPMMPDHPGYLVTGYQTVTSVVETRKTFFQNHAYNMDMLMGEGQIAGLNPPDHINLRKLLFISFNRHSVEEMQRNIILPLMNGLIDRLGEQNKADLVAEFTCRVPIYVIGELFGLPIERYNEFAGLATDLMNFGSSWENAIAASNRLTELFREMIEARKSDPGDDLVSKMLGAEIDGQKLTDQQMMSFCRALVPAGVETTSKALSSLFASVLRTPGCWDMLKNQAELIPGAVEESLRLNSPAQMIPKRTTAEVELDGKLLPADANLWVYLGHANRDGRQWSNPHTYDIARGPTPHLAFSSGPHTCLGMQLAKRELQDALTLMLQKLPHLKLDPDIPPPPITGFQFRSADRINVVTGPN